MNLTDNNPGRVFSREEVEPLFRIANKSIAELCRENEHLLIFPESISKAQDEIGKATVVDIQTTAEADQFKVITGNVMGFIGVGNLQMKIQSRFDEGRDDFLLHYMLQRVLSYNLFDLNHNNEQDDVFDFIMFMFPPLLRSALRQGLYREYQHYRHNDPNIKGPIDVGRHLARNIPFMGNIAYNTREYSHDNSMTQLIRHTIEFMKTKRYGQAVLNIDKDTVEDVKTIVMHTPLYNKNEREGIISKNLRMKTHPYYTEYRPLQTLCLQILRMEELKYGKKEDEVSGILFDGAWLWEEYVNTVLCHCGFTHAENLRKSNRIYLFNDKTGPRYPDFYKDDMVLDAKYKWLGKCNKVADVDRNDVHQVIAYMMALHVDKGGFVAPLKHKQQTVPSSPLWGRPSSALSIYGIEISKTTSSYIDFCQKMKDMEAAFVESLQLNG